jgi:hypothetical protein
MRWARIALAFSFVFGGVALAACGEGGEQTTTVTVQAEESEESASAPTPDPNPTPAEAEAYVEEFYDLINAYRYRAAWPLLPESVQDNAGSFAAWKAGYAANFASRSTDVHPFGASKNSVGVALSLIARDIDACTGATVKQVFTGAWRFARSGEAWAPQSIVMDKVEGGTPTIHAADCPAETPAVDPPVDAGNGPPPTTSPDPGYDPPQQFSGGDLDCDDVGDNIAVGPSDPNNFDADGDGIGCES